MTSSPLPPPVHARFGATATVHIAYTMTVDGEVRILGRACAVNVNLTVGSVGRARVTTDDLTCKSCIRNTRPDRVQSSLSRLTPDPTGSPDNRSKEPAMSEATIPTPRPYCRCGCKAKVVSPRATYLSGHDARHAGVVGRSLTGTAADAKRLATLPSDRLQAKALAVAATAKARATSKAKAKAPKKAKVTV